LNPNPKKDITINLILLSLTKLAHMPSPSSIPKSLCNKPVLLTDEHDGGASDGHHNMELGKKN
jgi:hypothetical protein